MDPEERSRRSRRGLFCDRRVIAISNGVCLLHLRSDRRKTSGFRADPSFLVFHPRDKFYSKLPRHGQFIFRDRDLPVVLSALPPSSPYDILVAVPAPAAFVECGNGGDVPTDREARGTSKIAEATAEQRGRAEKSAVSPSLERGER